MKKIKIKKYIKYINIDLFNKIQEKDKNILKKNNKNFY